MLFAAKGCQSEAQIKGYFKFFYNDTIKPLL